MEDKRFWNKGVKRLFLREILKKKKEYLERNLTFGLFFSQISFVSSGNALTVLGWNHHKYFLVKKHHIQNSYLNHCEHTGGLINQP